MKASSSQSARVVRALLRPHWAILVPAVLSAVIWLLPWTSDMRTGFSTKEELTPSALLFLGVWYALAAIPAYAGFILGRRIPPAAALERMAYPEYYLIFTCIGIAGVSFAYLSVVVTNPTLLMDAITHRTFNQIRSAIPYEAGVQTLRYAAILGGAFAMYRIASIRRIRLLDVLNFAALLGAAAIASRLSIVLAGLVLLALVLHGPMARSMRWWHLPAVVIAIALVLIPLNYVRNANFYERYYGVSDPVAMSGYEAIAYLAAPFQASVGVANNGEAVGSGPTANTIQAVERFLFPTYYPVKFEEVVRAEEGYRSYVDVQPQLTTNSALASMFSAMGISSFIFMPIFSMFCAIAAGHFMGYRSAVFLVGYILVYCYGELWRVFVFNFGIVHFLVLCLVGPPLALLAFGWLPEPWRRKVRHSDEAPA